MTSKNHQLKLLERKLKLIQYIAQSDTNVLDDIELSMSSVLIEKVDNKDAKKCSESTTKSTFSKSLLSICTEFYDDIAQQLEESQDFIDRLQTEEMNAEMIQLQLCLQIKCLQNASTQFLSKLENQLLHVN